LPQNDLFAGVIASAFWRQGRPLQKGRFLQLSKQPRHGMGSTFKGRVFLLAKIITPKKVVHWAKPVVSIK